jgi:hypothetical protein
MRVILKPGGLVVLLGALGALSLITLAAVLRASSASAAARPAPPPPVMFAPSPPATTPAASAGNLLANPGMETANAEGLPDGWTERWGGRGRFTVTRDTEVSRAPGGASLRAEVSGDGKSADGEGQIGQPRDAKAGESYVVRGWIRTEGSVNGVAGVKPFTANWTPANYLIAHGFAGASDWTPFETKVTLPKGTAHILVGVYVSGKGRVWLDDVTLSPAD